MTPEEIDALVKKAQQESAPVKPRFEVTSDTSANLPEAADKGVGEYIPPIIGAKVIVLSRKEELRKQLSDIERECGGFNNIPINSHYWKLRNEFNNL